MIGIFDSGSGGLTVLRAIRDVLPQVDILYYGDIKNAPYGLKSRDELSRLTIGAIKYLTDHSATSIVSACNSVSASLAVSLFDAFSIAPNNLIEMSGPTVSYFKGSRMRIALVATSATIDSGIYQTAFSMIGQQPMCFALPALGGAIELGETPEKIHAIIAEGCAAIDWTQYDVLILGCTHYPLVQDVFRKSIPATVGIFDPAVVVAERVEKRMWPREAGSGLSKFVITKESETFRRFVAELFPNTAYEIEVVK